MQLLISLDAARLKDESVYKKVRAFKKMEGPDFIFGTLEDLDAAHKRRGSPDKELLGKSDLWDYFRHNPEATTQTPERALPRNINTPKPKKKMGRNEPYPCASGLKYKKCHGRNA